MSELNTVSEPDSIVLKQRLAGLSASQRALLARRLEDGKTGEYSSGGLLGCIPRARPLRVEENPRVAVYPVSHGQQRMLFLHHYAPESPVYNIPTAFHLVGPLNIAWLEAAFHVVIQRHDILRTSFAFEKDEFLQRVAALSTFQLQSINLERIPADTRRTSAEQRLAEESCRLFDLAAGPPFRAVLVRMQPTEHVLLVMFHHIISDGWSRSNFCREISVAYSALATGQSPTACELPIQFADYSAWQRNWLQSGVLDAQTTYWKSKLAGDLEPLELPADHARPATESFRGGRCSICLDPKLTDALKTRAQEEGATLFMILLAAFKALLQRYTEQDDVIVGVPVANRQRVEVEGLIGFFVNTLVMRTMFPVLPTFRELLRCVKETAIEAYANQDMPFERLVELLKVRRDASRTPLFQTTFALQDFPAVTLPLPGIQTAPWLVTTHTSKFDLSLTVERSSDGWTATAEYCTDLFEAGRIERMLGHWRAMLESIATNPDQRVSELPLLTAPERHQVLVEWNRTGREYPRDTCVHQLIEEQMERTPEAVALEFEGQFLTYRELNARANQLAYHLRSLGVGPDAVVGLCVERSLEMVVALLGILKVGGAYVPLDPAFPPERLAFMIADSAMPVLVTQHHLADHLGKPTARRVWLDEIAWRPEPKNLPFEGASSSLAYVIYTSGSTGKPKGVEISHQALVNCLSYFRETLDVNPGDAWLAITTLSFDIAGLEIWLPLLAGARVVIATRETARDGRLLKEALMKNGVTILQATPATWQELLRSGWQGNPKLRILCGGEAMPQELADRLVAVGSRAWNVYGPTESTIWSTACQLVSNRPVNIGRPIANTQIYVLDSQRQLTPIGTPGDLFIGGESVARGYRNRPELTAERFATDPFSARPAARFYKTGDRAKWCPDGSLDFLGRADFQVKIRGFRIELAEIETALRAQPEVREVAVRVREDTPGDRRLVAYLVAHSKAKLDVATLRMRLGRTLPDYMLPNAFVWLDKLPLTPNGKLDHKALPAPETAVDGTPGEPDQPTNLLELELLRLWRRLFHREDIGRHDNFFELGGHSLLAARLTTEIDKLLGCKLPIAALFQSPTVESLTRRLTGENWAPPWRSLVPLQPLGAKPPFFLVHGWGGDVFVFLGLAQHLAPDQPAYGLQAVGLDGSSPRHATVETMAAHYVQEIRSFQPEGPYYLGGYSMGGLVAFEMAQQLHRMRPVNPIYFTAR